MFHTRKTKSLITTFPRRSTRRQGLYRCEVMKYKYPHVPKNHPTPPLLFSARPARILARPPARNPLFRAQGKGIRKRREKGTRQAWCNRQAVQQQLFGYFIRRALQSKIKKTRNEFSCDFAVFVVRVVPVVAFV